MPLVSFYYKPRMRLEGIEGKQMRTLQATPINSELRILCGIHFEENVRSIITLLKVCNPCEESPMCAYLVHLIELAGRATPVLAPYNADNRRLIRENPTYRIMCAAEKLLQRSDDFSVTIMPFKMIAPYSTMHESISKLAKEKFIPLLLLPFHKRGQGGAPSMHKLNINIQAYAPCTVGFLVDKGFGIGHLTSTGHFSYKVAVLFLGGPDDREAMALVSRMSGLPGVSISVYRIGMIEDEQEEDDCERHLDEIAISEFITRNIGNSCVGCREVVAENTIELMDAIRAMDSNYDLVIVGKRRAAGSQLDKEMSAWVEYKELGVIGDMLASVDFCKMSVLVMQCGLGSKKSIEEARSGKFPYTSSLRRNQFSFASSNCGRNGNVVAEMDDYKICTKV